jgi:hypothetical protein
MPLPLAPVVNIKNVLEWKEMPRFRFRSAGPKVLSLLAFASWLLLAVSWIMSVYAYPRLPAEVLDWSSLWSGETTWRARSVWFFVYPITQSIVFLAWFVLAKTGFVRSGSSASGGGAAAGGEERRLTDLKKEVSYLGLIFVNLVFIHLQTSLILVSHGLARGVNRFYFAMLLVVLVMLVPYYRIRRRMLAP